MSETDFDAPGVADFYDELPLWSAPFGQLILDRVPLVPRQTIVDIGAGTGFLTVELAQRSGRGTRVIAVDPWTAAMDRLERKLAHLALDNVTLQRAHAAKLELPSGSVDVIVSNLGLNNFDNASDILRECRRVLRRDGTILISSNLAGHMAEFYAVFRSTLVELKISTVPLDEHIARRATLAGVTAQLEQAGFTVTDLATDAFTMRYADGWALLNHRFIRLGFLPAWREIVEPSDREPVFAALERRLDSTLTLTIPAACVIAQAV